MFESSNNSSTQHTHTKKKEKAQKIIRLLFIMLTPNFVWTGLAPRFRILVYLFSSEFGASNFLLFIPKKKKQNRNKKKPLTNIHCR